MGHALMENRNGLVVDACLTEANGDAERIAALHMIEPRADRPTAITRGADKGYDTQDFVNELRSMLSALGPRGRRLKAKGRLAPPRGCHLARDLGFSDFGSASAGAGSARTVFEARTENSSARRSTP